MTSRSGGFEVLSLHDEGAVPIAGGDLQWIPLRRRLGAAAFGTNAYRAAKAGDQVVEDHVESPGQEELYLVVAGQARFQVDGDEVDVPAGSVVFVSDPEIRRGAVASEDETIVVAVGGWPGRPYHSLPWEPIYMAQPAMRRGDWSEAAQTLEREAGEHLDRPIIRFRLACCHAQMGDHTKAANEIRTALELDPTMRERVLSEELLEPLRGLESWDSIIQTPRDLASGRPAD